MTTTDSPISFGVNVLRLPASGMPVRFEADDEQKAALANAHSLVGMKTFHADLLVANWKRDGVKVTGRVKASIVQTCGVSLEPLDAVVDSEIHALFVPEGSRLARPDVLEGGEMLLDAEGEDGPEPFSGDTIDVGALAEEFFALGIDPYPRKAGSAASVAVDEDDEARGPLYEKLKGLKGKV
ncbi:YceD family protein [Aliihoeflea sp. PC F10.4]